MAVATVLTEIEKKGSGSVDAVAFSNTLVEVEIGPDVQENLNRAFIIGMGGTDITLPFKWAAMARKKYDAFMVLTDNEVATYGHIAPSKGVKLYRQLSGVADAKLFVCAFSVSEISVADPTDKFMFDFPGLDSALMAVIGDILSNSFYEVGVKTE